MTHLEESEFEKLRKAIRRIPTKSDVWVMFFMIVLGTAGGYALISWASK